MDKFTRLYGSKLDPDRLETLKSLLVQAPQEGLLAEVGVYKGGTLRVIAETLPNREIVGFDTFNGLPVESWRRGEYHQPGEFGDTSLESVLQKLREFPKITLVQGIFPASARGTRWDQLRYAFCHIDTDYYQSVFDAIVFFLPKMMAKGIILFDDYGWESCPGVAKAIQDLGVPVTVVEHEYINQAYYVD